ncbi:hypothetical protein GCM10020220_024820 [Nonomuraea rubra]|uniref:transketolase C-terminal domain-containing protein n=1 Tax=Nonomuraea rubra TaxID=46180 RepID=UPI0031E841D6
MAPSTPFDYVGLMNSALLCRDPVVVLEHVDLYGSTGECPVDDLDYCIPVGRARVRRVGSAVTVLTYLAMTTYALRAAEASGVDAEVIDLRWLDRASLDWETVGASVRKTNNVLIAEQGPVGTSYGGLAGGRDPAAALRLAGAAGAAGDGRGGVAEHQQGAGAGGHRPGGGSGGQARRDGGLRTHLLPGRPVRNMVLIV